MGLWAGKAFVARFLHSLDWHDSCIAQANRSDPVLYVAQFLHGGYSQLAGLDMHATQSTRQAMQLAHSYLACDIKDTQAW